MNAITGLKPNSKPPKANKTQSTPTTRIYLLYLLSGVLFSSCLFALQPTIKTPFWFGVFFVFLLVISTYLIFFKTYSFSVGNVPVLVNEEDSKVYKTVNRKLKDSKPLGQLPNGLKMAHYLGLGIMWSLFIAMAFYLIAASI